MGKIHKINPDRAYNKRNKCSHILKTLEHRLCDNLFDAFDKCKSMEELDKEVEKLLEEYYTFGNNVIDYYGIECGTVEAESNE